MPTDDDLLILPLRLFELLPDKSKLIPDIPREIFSQLVSGVVEHGVNHNDFVPADIGFVVAPYLECSYLVRIQEIRKQISYLR